MNNEELLKALDTINKKLGLEDIKTFGIGNIKKELDKAIVAYPNDMVMRRAAAVIHNRLQSNPYGTMSSVDLYNLFNSFNTSYSSSGSDFKTVMANFLPPQPAEQKSKSAPDSMRHVYKEVDRMDLKSLPQRMLEPIRQEQVKAPAPLRSLIDDIEHNLAASATPFSLNTVNLARTVLEAQLVNLGYKSYQLKLSKCKDGTLIYRATVGTPSGQVSFNVPVEISKSNNKEDVLLPTNFDMGGSAASLTVEAINKYAEDLSKQQAPKFDLKLCDTDLPESALRNELYRHALDQNFDRCEDVLGALQNKMAPANYLKLVGQYKDLLHNISTGKMEVKPASVSRSMSAVTTYSSKNQLKNPGEANTDILKETPAIMTSKIYLT